MGRKIIFLGCILGAVGVILGALGAHALKEVLTESQLVSFEVGVRYQIYHAILLLFVGGTTYLSDSVKKTVSILVFLGVLFFSGSIYLLSTNELTSINFKILGPITPVGGILLISAWLLVAFKALKSEKSIY
ncbi:DUF423 domain-containing protein [Myroides guanonis]|uniref:Uncharacterized membrane protein YgdD, TMEM256/DUF423 family n=1 Tax=Myroides guanonis TaxID=1150112 RepID=A0A1I3URJ8_9FLAO|nr:DUF423 domain-containing protein [Myroides guanonis]SFJ85592.1 Uncharacterized membrane protein YgdD, TMEM256/DUF423 family [Myroides guanonis]